MKTERFQNVIAFQSNSGARLGFHTETLEIAELHGLDTEQSLQQGPREFVEELIAWNGETYSAPEPPKNSSSWFMFSVNVAQICNLSCTYCGAGGDGTFNSPSKQIDFGFFKNSLQQVLSQLKPEQGLHIQFLGGEPLLYPGAIKQMLTFTKLYLTGSNRDLKFSVITNGTLITKDIATFLAENNFDVIVSFDGPAHLNNRTRPAKSKNFNSSQKTLKGLEALNQVRLGLNSLSVNSVYSVRETDLVECYEFLRQHDFDQYNFSYAAQKEDRQLSNHYVAALERLCAHVFDKYGFEELLKIAPLKVFLKRLQNKIPTKNFCSAGKNLLQLDTDGQIHICNWFSSNKKLAVGNHDALNLQKLKHYSDNNLADLNSCGRCWARNVCGGGCMFAFHYTEGDVHRKNESFCNRTKGLIALAIDYLFVYSKPSEVSS